MYIYTHNIYTILCNSKVTLLRLMAYQPFMFIYCQIIFIHIYDFQVFILLVTLFLKETEFIC